MPTPLPRIVTRKELRELVPFTPQYILKLEKAGKFPARIPIGQRRVGWRLDLVLGWIKEREAEGEARRKRNEENDAGGNDAVEPEGGRR